MTESIYVTAVNAVPKGETRSFGEIASLAGKPAAARAAGRTLTSYPVEGKAAWQRAVTASGGLSIDPVRADWQLEKLRADGARPRANESIQRWAKRVGAAFVGNWKNGQCFEAGDERVARLDPQFVERFTDADAVRARGFTLSPSESAAAEPLESRRPRPEPGRARSAPRQRSPPTLCAARARASTRRVRSPKAQARSRARP